MNYRRVTTFLHTSCVSVLTVQVPVFLELDKNLLIAVLPISRCNYGSNQVCAVKHYHSLAEMIIIAMLLENVCHDYSIFGNFLTSLFEVLYQIQSNNARTSK